MAKIEFKGIGQLSTVTESLVSIFADLAIGESDSYKEAIDLVHKNTSLTVHGQAMKKAIQNRITERALNSEVKKETLSLTGYRPEGERGISGCSGCPDGRTTYSHIAYANSADGRVDFSTTNKNGRRYIGFYQDFFPVGSTNPVFYRWVEMDV